MKLPIDLSRDEWKQFGLFAGCFFAIIGSYWMLRVVKNALFMDMVHHTYLPYAKIVSIANLVVMLLLYNKLVDWLGRQRLVRWLFGFYVVVFLLLYAMLIGGEGMAVEQKLDPRVALWTPVGATALLGVFMMIRTFRR